MFQGADIAELKARVNLLEGESREERRTVKLEIQALLARLADLSDRIGEVRVGVAESVGGMKATMWIVGLLITLGAPILTWVLTRWARP